MSNGRKVSTDALETLGTIIDHTQKRDAIHLAVLPVVAGERLRAGEDIRVENGVAMSANRPDSTGIVDPFLTVNAKIGDRFWMVLYPRMVTSLRHVWSHPAFADDDTAAVPSSTNAPARSVSQDWVAALAARLGVSSAGLMEAAEKYQSHGTYWRGGSNFEGETIPEEFWTHYEIVTGKSVGDDRESFLSCSC